MLRWDDEILAEYTVRLKNWLINVFKLLEFAVSHSLEQLDFGAVESSQSMLMVQWLTFSWLPMKTEFIVPSCLDNHLLLFQFLFWSPEPQQDKMLKEELEMPLKCEFMFQSDSMSVLRCVKNKSTCFHTFVANWVAVLREGSSPVHWRCVNRVANAGNCASRAMTAHTLLSCQRWLLGPEFLSTSEEDWPSNYSTLGCLQDGDPKVKMVYLKLQSLSCLWIRVSAAFVEYFQHGSLWHRLKKSVAWFLQYHGNLQKLSKCEKSREPIHSTPILSLPPNTVSEMEIAELEIIRNVQQPHFLEECEL